MAPTESTDPWRYGEAESAKQQATALKPRLQFDTPRKSFDILALYKSDYYYYYYYYFAHWYFIPRGLEISKV